MKKFGKIEAKYLKIGRLELLVFLSLVSTIILGTNSREKMWEIECKREKKNVFNSKKDEQLLFDLGELLFISFRISPEWRVCCEMVL